MTARPAYPPPGFPSMAPPVRVNGWGEDGYPTTLRITCPGCLRDYFLRIGGLSLRDLAALLFGDTPKCPHGCPHDLRLTGPRLDPNNQLPEILPIP